MNNQRKLTALLIDDEPVSTKHLRFLIEKLCPEIQVIAECHSLLDAMATINRHPVDLVFLDIEMPRGTGFQILEAFKDRSFDVIFVTAYMQYALKALKQQAIDYILKPIDPEELLLAVNKVIKTRFPLAQKQRLVVPTGDGYEFIAINQLLYCSAEGSYTHLFLQGGLKRLVSLYLKEIEERLPPETFIRIHQSYLVQRHCIRTFHRQGGTSICLSDGTILPVSRRRREQVLQQLQLK